MSDDEIFEFSYDSEDEVLTPLSTYDDDDDAHYYFAAKPDAWGLAPQGLMYECVICKQVVTKGTKCCNDEEVNNLWVGTNYHLWLEMAR